MWLRELDSFKQQTDKPVDTYYSKFKRLVKRVNTGGAIPDAHKQYYFKKVLRTDILLIILIYALADLLGILNLARVYEQGTNFAINTDLIHTTKTKNLEKDIKFLI